ncbi:MULTISPECIES: hypothetical protein [unclassified Bradyrhizobium]|uniref:hypothetical protein n=1 Tax=unclassified Bradyrhizobium TaxID=2631580 RepID=UPI002FF1F303
MSQLDQRDQNILAARVTAWEGVQGPRVGDYVIMPDGEYRRFTHDWGADIQTTCKGASGSFYFGTGYMDYSGGLDPALLKSRLVPTDEIKPGPVWFFHHNERRAHNGVYALVDCRVYRYVP